MPHITGVVLLNSGHLLFLCVLFLGFEIWEVPIRSNDPLLLYYVHFQENRCWYRALGHLRDAGFTNF